MPTPRVSIIVVSYRSQPVIEQLLASLGIGADSPGRDDLEVVIVSNSGDCSPLARDDGLVRVIDSGANLGFGRANNLGARHARAATLLFCNPDVQLSAEIARAIGEVLEAHPECGIVTPYQNHEWCTCHPTGRVNPCPDAASGGCFAMTAANYARLGGFDADFFLWYEDTDLSARVRKAGLQIGYADGLVVRHTEGHSTRPPDRARRTFLTRVWLSSHYLYLLKHKGRAKALRWCAGMMGMNLVRSITGKLPAGRPYHLPSAASAFGARIIANLWRDRHFVTFNGKGFVWGLLPAEPRTVVIHPLEPARQAARTGAASESPRARRK